MAVQLPTIKADSESVGSAPAPRIEEQPLDTARPMQQQQQAVEGAAQEVIKFRNDQEYREADNIATEADNKFQDWHKKQLYGDPTSGKVGLLYQEGDPKVNFDKFYKDAQDKLNDLSSADKDQSYSDLTQTVVNRRLNKRAQELHNESLTAYGHAKYEYDKDTMKTNVDFAQKAMPLISSSVDPDHPETFAPLQAKIDDVKEPIINHALQYGGAIKTDDGQTVLTPAVKAQVAKAVSDGLYKTIDNLYNSDQGDGVAIKKADAIKEQFADQLDPFNKEALSDKSRETVIKQKAYQLSSIIEAKGANAPEVQAAGPEVRQKALAYANENGRAMEQMQERKQKINYEAAAKPILDRQQSDTPFAGIEEMKNDPVVKRVWDNLSAKQQQNLEHLVEAPKSSSDTAIATRNNLLAGKDKDGNPISLTGMNQTTLATYKAGLSKLDQKDLDKKWIQYNSATGPQLQSQQTALAKTFESQAIGAGLVNYYPGTHNITDPAKYENMKKELSDSVDEHTAVMSPKERSAYVASYIADKKAGNAFTPPTRNTFNGSAVKTAPPQGAVNTPPNVASGTAPTPPLKGAAAYYGNLPDAAKMTWMRKYKQQYGPMGSSKQLFDFIDKQTAAGN